MENKDLMETLAEKTNLTTDGDDRLFYDDESIHIYCNLLDEEQYDEMETEMGKATITRKHYEVYAWNDCSGYEYWSAEGEGGGCNYIQVTVAVKDPSKVKPEQLKRDVEEIHSQLCHWANVDEWLDWKNDQREEELENEK